MPGGLQRATENFLKTYTTILMEYSKRVPLEYEKQLGTVGSLPPPTQSPMAMIINGGYSHDPIINKKFGLMRHLTDTFVDSVTVFSSPSNHRLLQSTARKQQSEQQNDDIDELNTSLKGVTRTFFQDMTEDHPPLSSTSGEITDALQTLKHRQEAMNQSPPGGLVIGSLPPSTPSSSSSSSSTTTTSFNNPGSRSVQFKKANGLEAVFDLIQGMQSVSTECDYNNRNSSTSMGEENMDQQSKQLVKMCRNLLSGGSGTRQSGNVYAKDDFWKRLNRESLRTMLDCEHYNHLSDAEEIQQTMTKLLLRDAYQAIQKRINQTYRILRNASGFSNSNGTDLSPEDLSSPTDVSLASKMGMGSTLNLTDILNTNARETLSKATLALREQSPLYQWLLINRFTHLNNTKISPPVSRILEDGLKAKSLRLHHSEENQCTSNLLLANCRDSKLEKCIDACVLTPYLLKFNYTFSKTPSDSATMLTFFLSRTMGLCNSDSNVKNTSSEFASLKNAVTDNESLLKNCVRYLRLHNRCNDAIHQVAPATCNCPFTLHHAPTTGGLDEFNNPQMINYDNDFGADEIAQNPYIFHQMVSMKNYALHKSKIDPRQRGNAIIKSLLRATNCGLGSTYRDFFVPTRSSLENCVFRPAGVNLGVIVSERNLKALTTRAQCWKRHICMPDLLTTTAVTFGDSLSTGSKIKVSTDPTMRLEEFAISPNTYLQHSSINPALIFMSNTLFSIHTLLLDDIKSQIKSQLLSAENPNSVVSSSRDVTKDIQARLDAIKIPEMVGALQNLVIQQQPDYYSSHMDNISRILSNNVLNAGKTASGLGTSHRDKLLAGQQTLAAYGSMREKIVASAHNSICSSLQDLKLPYNVENQDIANVNSLMAPADGQARQKMNMRRKRQEKRRRLVNAGLKMDTSVAEYDADDLIMDDSDSEDDDDEGVRNQREERIKDTKDVLSIIFTILGQNKEDKRLLEKVTKAIHEHVSSNQMTTNITTMSQNTDSVFSDTLWKWTKEIAAIVGVIDVINKNVSGILNANPEKIRMYFSTLQTISRLRWFLTLGMSNSTSVDLSHLNAHLPLQLEDSTVMSMSHPVLQLVFPEVFATMFVEEQTLRDTLVNQVKNRALMLNHPNILDSLVSAQYAMGAGGRGPNMFSLSTLMLNESTLLNEYPTPVTSSVVENDGTIKMETEDGSIPPELDTNPTIVNPFANGKLDLVKEGKYMKSGGECGYLAVSAPTQFSGLINSTTTTPDKISGQDETAATIEEEEEDEEKEKDKEENMVTYGLLNNRIIKFPKLKPHVLATDANEPLMDSLCHKNLTLTNCTHEIGVLEELLVAIEMTLGNSELNQEKNYADVFKRVWERIKDKVIENNERILAANANKNYSSSSSSSSSPPPAKVEVTGVGTIKIVGENIPDRSGDYCNLFESTLKTLLETAHSQLKKTSAKVNTITDATTALKKNNNPYKPYYDLVMNSGISFRDSLSNIVSSPEAFASVNGNKVSREGAAVTIAEKIKLVQALEEKINKDGQAALTSSVLPENLSGGNVAPGGIANMVGPQLGSFVTGYLSIRRLKKMLDHKLKDLKSVTKTSQVLVHNGVKLDTNTLSKIEAALSIIKKCEHKVYESLIKYLVAGDYMSLNRADLSPHVNLLSAGGPNNEFSSLMHASDPSGEMFLRGEGAQLLSTLSNIKENEDVTKATNNLENHIFQNRKNKSTGMEDDNIPKTRTRFNNNMAFESTQNYSKNVTFSRDSCSLNKKANYRDDIGNGMSIDSAFKLINRTNDEKAVRVQKALASAIMNRGNQNALSNAFLGSRIIETSKGIAGENHIDSNGGDVQYSNRGKREQMSSAIINVLRANPTLFAQTLTALGNFDATAQVASQLGNIYSSVGGSNIFGMGSSSNKNNCKGDFINEMGIVDVGLSSNVLWIN